MLRAAIYAEAGADGLFVPMLMDVALIAELTGATHLPVNIMAVEGIASVDALTRAGARRISCGAWAMQESTRWTGQAAAAFAGEGIYPSAKSKSV
jgi:2-methylisocitrate lyase-like PEP mutase family enzyme